MHAMGHRADWKQCSLKLLDFLSRRLSSTIRWNGQGIVCLPSRVPVFLKIKKKKKKKSRSGRKSGRSGMINKYFFLLGLNLRLSCLSRYAEDLLVSPGRVCEITFSGVTLNLLHIRMRVTHPQVESQVLASRFLSSANWCETVLKCKFKTAER